MHTAASAPVILSRDAALRAAIERLCAAAGVTPDFVDEPEHARRPWATASCVVVGADCAEEMARLGLDRRGRVVLASADPESTELWRRGIAIGAEHVVLLPDGGRWLVEWLIQVRDRGSADGIALGVVGGRGGAGASTFAAALSRTAADLDWRVLLVDADPLSGGIDLVVGCDEVPGFRWPDVTSAHGQVSAAALRGALPAIDGLAVLSGGFGAPRLEDVRDVVQAARRGSDLVVVDLPRREDSAMRAVVSALDLLVVATTTDVRSAAGAGQMITALLPWCADVRLTVRTKPRTLLPATEVAASLGIPLVSSLTTRRSVQRSVDEGLGPTLGGRERRSLRQLLESLQRGGQTAVDG